MSIKSNNVFLLIKDSIIGWAENDAFLHASSLAYYPIFSVAPLVIISVGIAGLFFTKAAVEGLVVNTLEGFVGIEVATLIQDIILNASFNRFSTSGILVTILGLVILLYGGAIVFFSGCKWPLTLCWALYQKQTMCAQTL